MTTKIAPVCLGCTRFQGRHEETAKPVCSSFPEGIPANIWKGDDPHVVSRDGEPIYEPKDVAALASFVLYWVAPHLNPRLVPRWGMMVRKLNDLRRAKEKAPAPKPKKAS